MKMKIEITQIETGFRNDEKIVEIDINNGHWKYWDKYSKSDEKMSLTMNTIFEATFLHQPVKDALFHFDSKIWEEQGEIVQDDAYVRTYDTLIRYLHCRVGNLKDNYKRRGETELETHIVLFEKQYVRSNEDDVTANIVYEKEGLLNVKLTVVE